MFSNLNPGNVIYVLDIKNNYNVLTGQVNKVTPIRPKYNPNTIGFMYGQGNEMVVDIYATVNGEHKEFREVPSSAVTADFGSDTVVLADSKDAMIGYLNVTYQNSKAVVESREKNEQIMINCQKALDQLNPPPTGDTQRDSAILALQEQIKLLTQQITKLAPENKLENNKINN